MDKGVFDLRLSVGLQMYTVTCWGDKWVLLFAERY